MSLQLALSTGDPLASAVDVSCVFIAEGASVKNGVLAQLAKALGPSFSKQLKKEEFTGKKDQTFEITTNGLLRPVKILLMGIGPESGLNVASVRTIVAKAARWAQSNKASTMAVSIPSDSYVRSAAEGTVLGSYRFKKYLTGDRLPKSELTKATIFLHGRVGTSHRDALREGQSVADAVCIARDLVNEPPNEMYPEAMAKFAQQMCKENGLEINVMDKQALLKRGMKLILAVGQGSARDPRLIHMHYKPTNANGKKLVFVGKGLTFDSGGLCIKPAAGMEEMKGDMAGAANVIAMMSAVAALKPRIEVHGIVAAAENMPDGAAYRPGDIFGSLDGKTVEIINTDAEGRLVLADALAYARQLKPDLLIDNATLTGACVVALGPTVSGFYATNADVANVYKDAAAAAGEAAWQMPLVEELRDGLKSDWADLKHVADRWGGSITAALFLREFVGDVPWIHVDIAGPFMASKPYGIYPKGGTGYGVLTFLRLIEEYATR